MISGDVEMFKSSEIHQTSKALSLFQYTLSVIPTKMRICQALSEDGTRFLAPFPTFPIAKYSWDLVRSISSSYNCCQVFDSPNTISHIRTGNKEHA